MIIKLEKVVYVRGEKGNLCTARFRIREKKSSKQFGHTIDYRYLYLTYRDGKKIKEIYVVKLESR